MAVMAYLYLPGYISSSTECPIVSIQQHAWRSARTHSDQSHPSHPGSPRKATIKGFKVLGARLSPNS